MLFLQKDYRNILYTTPSYIKISLSSMVRGGYCLCILSVLLSLFSQYNLTSTCNPQATCDLQLHCSSLLKSKCVFTSKVYSVLKIIPTVKKINKITLVGPLNHPLSTANATPFFNKLNIVLSSVLTLLEQRTISSPDFQVRKLVIL
jgi:hypothetical protein